jgi:hypothetical protein
VADQNCSPSVNSYIKSVSGASRGRGGQSYTDLRTDNNFELPPFYGAHNIVSTIDVVIKGDDQPYGVLEIDNDEQHLDMGSTVHHCIVGVDLCALSFFGTHQAHR